LGTAIKHRVPVQVKQSFSIFDIRALQSSGLSVIVPKCQKLQKSLTRSGARCFIAVPIWQQWTSKGIKQFFSQLTGFASEHKLLMTHGQYLSTFADASSVTNEESCSLTILQYHLMSLTLNTPQSTDHITSPQQNHNVQRWQVKSPNSFMPRSH